MFTKSFALVLTVAAMAALSSAPAFASKISLNNEMLAGISGSANDYTFSGNSLTSSTTADSQLITQPSSGNNTSDLSQNKVASNQSGANSQVQQNISGINNALVSGAVSQNAVIVSGGTSGTSFSVNGYARVGSATF